MSEELYVVTPEINAWIGKAEFRPDMEFPWDDVSISGEIDARFEMNIDWKRLKEIDLDYFNKSAPIVSEKFSSVCLKQRVDCQLVPLDIVLNGNKVDGKYYFILLNKFISFVNMEKATFTRMMTRDGTRYEVNKNFPEIPEFDSLEKISINNFEKPPFFMAPEIGFQRVCTGSFKAAIESDNIKGVVFTPIDKNFKYESLSFD
jgi:hypothetical protein